MVDTNFVHHTENQRGQMRYEISNDRVGENGRKYGAST